MKMTDYVHLMPRYLVVEIEKPLFVLSESDVIRVSEEIIKRAIRNFVPLVIRTPHGEKIFYPKTIKKDGKKVKQVFLYPDHPMTMYEIEVPHGEKKPLEAYQFS